jgi:uncharacterized protein YycO
VPFVPRKGDFGLAAGGGAIMRVVRLGTFSRFGHACIAEDVADPAAIVVIEPMPTGCRRRTAHPREFVWSALDLTDEQRDTIVRYATTTVGLPYDWVSIAGFLLRFWGGKLRLPSSDHPDRKLICSELVVWAYREAGVDLAPGRPPGDVSPGDLDQFLDDQRRA